MNGCVAGDAKPRGAQQVSLWQGVASSTSCSGLTEHLPPHKRLKSRANPQRTWAREMVGSGPTMTTLLFGGQNENCCCSRPVEPVPVQAEFCSARRVAASLILLSVTSSHTACLLVWQMRI